MLSLVSLSASSRQACRTTNHERTAHGEPGELVEPRTTNGRPFDKLRATGLSLQPKDPAYEISHGFLSQHRREVRDGPALPGFGRGTGIDSATHGSAYSTCSVDTSVTPQPAIQAEWRPSPPATSTTTSLAERTMGTITSSRDSSIQLGQVRLP